MMAQACPVVPCLGPAVCANAITKFAAATAPSTPHLPSKQDLVLPSRHGLPYSAMTRILR